MTTAEFIKKWGHGRYSYPDCERMEADLNELVGKTRQRQSGTETTPTPTPTPTRKKAARSSDAG